MNIIFHPPPFWGSSRQFSRVCNPTCFNPSQVVTEMWYCKNSGFWVVCTFCGLEWLICLGRFPSVFGQTMIFLALELHAFPRKNTGRKRNGVGFWRSRGKEREPTEVVGRLQDLHSSFGDLWMIFLGEKRWKSSDGFFVGVVVDMFCCRGCCGCWFNGCPTRIESPLP